MKSNPMLLFAIQIQIQVPKQTRKEQKQKILEIQYSFHPKPKATKILLQDQTPKTKLQPSKNQHQKGIVLLQMVQTHTHMLLLFPNQVDEVLLLLLQKE